MKRRNFLKSSAMSMSFLAIPNFVKAGKSTHSVKLEVVKPPRLQPGDKVGLVSPGSFIKQNELEECIENLKKLELDVYHTERVTAKYGYLAGTDKERSDDLMHMFENDDVKGIICTRGGYGCNRILSMLDYQLIREHPKVLVGYSDITALNYALYAQSRLISFHGPVGISTFNEYSVNYLKKTIMNPTSVLNLENSEENLTKDKIEYQGYVINEGIAEGELVGGNLSIAASLLGTPYDVDYSGKIIYLEDIGEEPYRIDRMLTELLLAGHLQKAAGIALGVFVDCEIDEDKPSFNTSFRLKEVIIDRLAKLNIPTVYGLSFGHIANKYTLPFGLKCRLDTNNKLITLLDTPVV